MSGRALQFVVVVATLVAIAVVFWPSEQQEQDEQTAREPESSSGPASGAPTAAPAASQRRDWFPDLSDAQPALTTGDTASQDSRRFDCRGSALEDLVAIRECRGSTGRSNHRGVHRCRPADR